MELAELLKPYLNKKIGVLMGGLSSEREISLRSGENVYNTLLKMGLNAIKIDVGPDIWEELRRYKIDIAFNVLHGKFGEDGTIQGLLEIMGIPYTGSGVLGSAIAMNKLITKKILKQSSIPVPSYVPIDFKEVDKTINTIESQLGYPFVLKPNNEGSSIGVKLIKDRSNLDSIIDHYKSNYPDCFAEQYINGREITIGVVGNKEEIFILPIMGLKPKNEFYDFHAKYTKGMTDFELPAKINSEKERIIKEYTIKAFRELHLNGVVRFDVMLDMEDNPFFLEANTLPGMTETSDIPAMARAANCYEEIIIKILDSSIK